MRYLLAVLLMFAAAADAKAAPRIIHGHPVLDTRAPYYAALVEDGSADPYCGGSVVRRDVILTAAHCIGSTAPFVRTITASGRYTYVRARSARMNPRYDPQVGDAGTDMALVYTWHPIKDARLVRLARHRPSVGRLALVVGYGVTESEGQPGALQGATLRIQDPLKCTFVLGGLELRPGEVCAGWRGEPFRDSCSGDSGGPLLVGGYQVGTVSYGPENCDQGLGVYGSVAQSTWLRKVLH